MGVSHDELMSSLCELSGKQTDQIRSCPDACDLQSDNSACKCFLDSLQDSLKKDVQTTKTKEDDLFADVFVAFIENERPVSGHLCQSMERKVLFLCVSKFTGGDVKVMASAAWETIQELIGARMWDSLKNTTLCCIFATALPNNTECSNPMCSLLDKVKAESLC